MHTHTLATLSLLALPALTLLNGCASDPTQGYSMSSSYDQSVRTVAVPMFENGTYSRGLEAQITDSIIKEIQRATPWRVVQQSSSGGGANTTLTGKLTDSHLRSLSTNRDTGYTQELSVELAVDFEWKDNRTGKVLVSRKNFVATESFVPAIQGGSEHIEVGQHAAVQRLAKDIVSELRSTW